MIVAEMHKCGADPDEIASVVGPYFQSRWPGDQARLSLETFTIISRLERE
jgi:hypothetical protein